MSTVLHPTKEQVRAYMHLREFDRRPPPTPAEIRQQLGWYGYSSLNTNSGNQCLFLPSTIAQLATLLAVEWCFLAAGVSRSR